MLDDADADAAHRQHVIKRLYIATILCSVFMIVEIIGGLISGSLAVLSDAVHLFADLASFAVAIAASYLAALPATTKHTYGLKRIESLAALFSMISLGFVSVGLSFEALRRLVSPPEDGVDGVTMTLIAGIGVVVNVALALVLGENHVHLPGGTSAFSTPHDHNNCESKHETSPLLIRSGGHDHEDDHHQTQHRNVNLHAAYLHALGDLAQSFAVFLGGAIIWWKPEWHIIDPILTLGFSALVLWSTIGVVRSSVAILLEETPPGIEWRKVKNTISAVPNVYDVHDLHIWCISHGEIALSVHCTSTDEKALCNINKACQKFGIKHSTIQVDTGSCSTCDPKMCCTSKINELSSS
eukprot:jgi/Psemu1/260498/estExt_Genewise1Plus.C_4680004